MNTISTPGNGMFFSYPPRMSPWLPCVGLISVLMVLIGCDDSRVRNKTGEPGSDKSVFSQYIPVAGGGSDWNSGGGYAPNDQFNPWFVQNTQKVSFCISIDQENFGLSLSEARQGIIEAISFWKSEFETARAVESAILERYSKPLRTATQEFVEEPCSKGTDISIQLGTLSDEQKRAVPEVKNYLAFTTRTAYDKLNLKGKGFIYVAPMKGNNRPEIPYTESNIWEPHMGWFFKMLVAHEFGHVFGLTYAKHDLMSPGLMSFLPSFYSGSSIYGSVKSPIVGIKPSLRAYFSNTAVMTQTRRICYDGRANKFILPVAGEVDCISIELDFAREKAKDDFAHVALFVSKNGIRRPYIRFEDYGATVDLDPLVQVFLPEGQKVFRQTEIFDPTRIKGEMIVRRFSGEGKTFVNEGLQNPEAFSVDHDPQAAWSKQPLHSMLVFNNDPTSESRGIKLDVYQWTIDAGYFLEDYFQFLRFDIVNLDD